MYEQLKKLVFEGAKDKKLDLTDIVLDRINYELSIIEKKDFSEYFIIFSRIIEVCNELNLIRSFGRGSAASSIVNYCLDITKLNPIDENLIFERFIRLDQKRLPDIDIDIPKGQQQNVIERLKQKYPEYHIYHTAYIPENNYEYESVFFNDIEYKKDDYGIIISSEKLTNSVFQYEGKEFYLALDRWNDLIYYNKFDLVELEYLNRLQLIVNEIGEEFHPYNLPLDDKKVFDFLASGDLDNIFQLNQHKLEEILNEFRPNSMNDLSIINALFRPHLHRVIPFVVKHKINSEYAFKFSDERVSEILEETYCQFFYHETFLNFLKTIAGIPFSEGDKWRIRISRDKTVSERIAFSSVFAKGCRENSALSEFEIQLLARISTEMLPMFFQKSHSFCYAMISYWGAYYRFYFREEFDNAFKGDIKFQKFELL